MSIYKHYKNILYSFFILCLLVLSFCFTSFAGSWKEEDGGWRYIKEDGSYPKSQWMWVDGNLDGYAECYYFDESGRCLINRTTPDGYTVDTNGSWTVNGAVQRKLSVSGTLGFYDESIKIKKLWLFSWMIILNLMVMKVENH
jgi:cysteine-rich secretory protein family./putative cell wall binding repeat